MTFLSTRCFLLTAALFLGFFYQPYAIDEASVGKDLESASKNIVVSIGEITAEDKSKIKGGLKIRVKTATVQAHTNSGQTELTVGGAKMGEPSTQWYL